ncbi:diguanylate cyclase domain-containing protein [Gallaecimonas xiamenensis]|uniref:Diguanylate cyclase n=1 Tax=Gallaecimonas xiamenensis 3-C-1 TaxID=745411 RepID=K2IQ92_9GAMM|nr:diguanylate cyclase [Gallaecimonas xiamenensis]EKE72336.1 diguanylate cyclase [Gallaecimonas xiamenensis 3-C-1]
MSLATRPPKWPWLLAAVVFVAVLTLAEYVVRLQELHAREAMRAKHMAALTELRANLESSFNAPLHLGQGLVSFLRTQPNASPEQINAMLGELFKASDHLRNIAAAPDLVMRYVYPLKGNEAVIGVDYRTLPLQWAVVQDSLAQKKTLLDGPVSLVQGGTGVVARSPVLLDGGQAWGMVGMVLDLDGILEDAGFHTLQTDFELSLENSHKSDGWIAGDKVLPQPQYRLPVKVLTEHWTLLASPRPLPVPSDVPFHLAALLLAGAFAGLVWLLLQEHQKAIFWANHDHLTSLPNRRCFMHSLENALEQWHQRRRPFALFYLDLNDFKGINDRYGHAVGDGVLGEVAKRLALSARKHDLVARVGGDEFVLLLQDLASLKDVQGAAQRFVDAVQAPMFIRGQELQITVALGQARPARQGDRPDDLIRQADFAMYRHKPQAIS